MLSPSNVRLTHEDRKLLLAVLDVRTPLRDVDSSRIDWTAVIAAADAAKILTTLAQRVLASDLVLDDPRAVDTLQDMLHETAAQNTRLLAELVRCAKVLDAAGIEHVALKGAALMARHYPHLAMRYALDLDLVIDPERFDEGVALMRAAGYVEPPYTQTLMFDGRTFGDALNAPHWHSHAPLHSPSGVNVDIHRRVPVTSFDAAGGFRGLRARSESVIVHGVRVQVCGARDLALHLCEHFALQNHADPKDAARLLCDLRAMFEVEPPWAELMTHGVRQRAAVALSRCLYDAVFTCRDDDDVLTQSLQRLAVADPAVAKYFVELSRLGGFAERFAVDLLERPGFALRKLLPTREYLVQRYGMHSSVPRMYAQHVARLLLAPLKPVWPWR